MPQFWENDPTVEEQAQQPALRQVLSVPDPDAARENRREDVADARDARDEARVRDNDAFERTSKLRTEFLGLEDVKSFRQVQNSTRQIIGLAERDSSAMGDLGLVFSYMKALDPGSTVREGEFATAQNATGVPGAIRNAYNQIKNGERLSDAQRSDMANTARAILNSRAQGYNDLVETYQGLISAEGADPIANGIVPFEITETPTAATTQEAIQSGQATARLGMDSWGDNDVFDRNAFLEEAYGITGDKEARLTASLNQLSGQEVSATQLAALYGQLDIPLPPESELQTMAETLKQGQRFSGFDTSDAEQQYVDGLRQLQEQRGGARTDEEVMAAQGGLWGGSDEIAGVAGGIGAAFRGQNPILGYQVNRDAERLAVEDARENLGGMGTAIEIGSGLATGGVRVAPALARTGLRMTPSAINEARAAGAIAGFNYGEGAADSAVGAVGGAVTGDLAARGLGAIGRRLAARKPSSAQSEGREVIEAADRVNANTGSNIQPLPADAGGATVRRATSGVAQSTLGAAPIVNAAQRVNDEAASAVGTLASREGTALTTQGAGEKALDGAEKTMRRLKTKVDANYTKARKLSGDTRVPLNNARATLDQHLAEVMDTPGGSQTADTLADLRQGLEGDWTPEGIRRMRTEWRDRFIKDGLRGSDRERRVNDIIDAAELDIEQGLAAAGKTDAAKAWKTASKSAADRYALIDEVLTPIIGKKGEKSGEQAYGAIDRLSRGDAVKLGKFMKALPADEAGAVRATIISRLGRSTKGQQDASGEAFSLSRFLTNWNDEGLSKEAKSALFGGELRAALDDLARVAQGSKEAQRYANHSNTSGANMVQGALAFSPFAFFDMASAAAVATGAAGVQNLSGRVLASPSFARWLAKAGKVTTPGAAKAHAQGLTKIASKDAAIGAEIIDFQQYLLRQLESAPSRSAAAEDQSSTQRAEETQSREGGQ